MAKRFCIDCVFHLVVHPLTFTTCRNYRCPRYERATRSWDPACDDFCEEAADNEDLQAQLVLGEDS